MEKSYYFAVVEKEPGTEFGVWFPDFPGCVSAATDHTEALRRAAEALQLHVDGMVEDGEAIPEPTKWDDLDVRSDVRPDGGRLVTLVEVRIPEQRRLVRVNITIDSLLLDQIKRRTDNTSAFLADAARRVLGEQG